MPSRRSTSTLTRHPDAVRCGWRHRQALPFGPQGDHRALADDPARWRQPEEQGFDRIA